MTHFTAWDAGAVGLLFGVWMFTNWRIETERLDLVSMTVLMKRFRREWMRQMVTRKPRIFDATILGGLRQGTAFFASAALIATGGVLALLGNTEQLIDVAGDLTLADVPAIVWDVKLFVVLFFVTNAFLKFVWSNRLFGYSAVLMAAVPNEAEDPAAYPRAGQAGEINITAARSFNRGLRSVYFGLAAAAWLVGSAALIVAVLVTFGMLWRREFASRSRSVLLESDSHKE